MRGSQLFVSVVIILILLGGIYYHKSIRNHSVFGVDIIRKDDSIIVVKATDDEEQLLIQDDDILKTKKSIDLLRLYERYTSSMQILCRNIQRTGGMYDGGKEVCMDKSMKPQKPCIVYSFGSANNFDFEKEVVSLFGCEVQTFDPSLGNRTINKPDGCSFDPIGISDKEEVNRQGWIFKTFSNITKMFKHTKSIIDILKMDIESSEWKVISQMTRSGSLKNVKQLLVEFHFTTNDVASMSKRLAVFRDLYRAGFRIFQRERNAKCRCHRMLDGRKIASLVEIAFLNIDFITHS